MQSHTFQCYEPLTKKVFTVTVPTVYMTWAYAEGQLLLETLVANIRLSAVRVDAQDSLCL